MTNILPSGSLNPNSTIAPGVYILEKLPASPIQGAETDVILAVGTGSWGPVNYPVTCGSLQEFINNFGNPQNLQFDMGTQVMCATSLGAANFLGLRVTDGTDVAATVGLLDTNPSTGVTLTAKYTGSVGNTINVTVGVGTNSVIGNLTYKVTIYLPTGNGSSIPEIYDNIGGTGATFWQNVANAINMGQGGFTAPSQLVTAAVGVGVAPPDLTNYVLAGGTDGNSGVVSSDLVGSNVLPLTGMYAASGADFSLMMLCGVTDDTTFQAQADFGQTEGALVILARPLGETYADGILSKKTIGLVSYATKLMVGETWVKIQDTFNNVQRYVPQQGFVAGKYSTLEPQESALNKPISSGIFVSTYFSDQNMRYTQSDIVTMLQNGVDTIANPAPGGAYWSLQTGKNTSSDPLASGDQFTRLTNYLASSIQVALGVYIGTLQNDTQRKSAKTKLDSFLNALARRSVIGATNGGQPFSVVIDNSNNPPPQVAQGIEVADINVAFLQVVVAFLVNLQTGSVSISTINRQ